MKIFLDFDRTLYDLDAEHEDGKRVVESHGVSRGEYDRTRKFFAGGSGSPLSCYTTELHVDSFSGIGEETKQSIVSGIGALLDDGEKYVFEDVSGFLKSTAGHELIILTFGDEDFQRKKIHGSGLDSYANDIIVTSGDKWNEIKSRLGTNETCVFVDDHPDYFSTPMNVPGVMTIHLARPGITRSACGGCHAMRHISNLSELDNLL
ncbi:hypothetical protein L0Y69_00440 [bacterium]|nr:hypothetical protein [bacterium]